MTSPSLLIQSFELSSRCSPFVASIAPHNSVDGNPTKTLVSLAIILKASAESSYFLTSRSMAFGAHSLRQAPVSRGQRLVVGPSIKDRRLFPKWSLGDPKDDFLHLGGAKKRTTICVYIYIYNGPQVDRKSRSRLKMSWNGVPLSLLFGGPLVTSWSNWTSKKDYGEHESNMTPIHSVPRDLQFKDPLGLVPSALKPL